MLRSSSSNLLGAAALLALLAGCQPGVTTQGEAPAPDTPPPSAEADAPAPPTPTTDVPAATVESPLATYRPDVPEDGVRTSATARLTGTLALRDGCLVLEVDGGDVVQPVFPAGQARWDASARRLEVGGASHALGDRVTLGGGGVPSDGAFVRDGSMEGPRCEGTSLFVVS